MTPAVDVADAADAAEATAAAFVFPKDTAVAGGREARANIRAGRYQGRTAGMAPAIVQANLAILPAEYAGDFLRFCQLNPKPCPLLGMSEPGNPTLPMLGRDIDVRTDLSAYRVFRDGVETDEVSDLDDYWRDDLVAFAIGCSLSFDWALMDAGLPVRRYELGMGVSAYRTTLETTPAGPFSGGMVVSMRSFTPANAIRAIQITSRFPNVHGAPVHFGDPGAIGIKDILKPDYGDWAIIPEGDVPVFWACGITPQVVIEQAKPPLCITHKPGHMLITDLLNAELASM
ncbi:MAG: putative hydro-lyase [Alphaproteobacteria bacterium]|nr:putative hydro-lyase [Alphaproteobacteria bacterium]